MTAPTIEQAKHELTVSENLINFHSPEWKVFEEWLGWRRYTLAIQILAQADDVSREKMHGMATMCMELLKMGEAGRRAVANKQPL